MRIKRKWLYVSHTRYVHPQVAQGGAVPFQTTAGGKWLIEDPEGPAALARAAAESGMEDGLTFGSGIHRDRAGIADGRKRARKPWGQEDEDSDDDNEQAAAASSKAQSKRAKPGLGKEYRSKKAAGDVMRKTSTLMPHAYIALDHQQLNRRKRAKQVSEFKSTVAAAKRGAVQGRKNRR